MKFRNILFVLVFAGVVGAALFGMFREPVVLEEPVAPSANIASNSQAASVSGPTGQGAEVPAPGLYPTKMDDQGAVTVEITPQDVVDPTADLVFDVALNTHSVDLSMDLASMTTLQTDDGKVVPARKWDTPVGGGHHVSGQLIFPASLDGIPLLEGAGTFSITIVGLDAPERVFTWQK